MQDIVGARVVVPELATQETVLELLLREFADCQPVVAKDTRAVGDELGYRAVHVVVQLEERYAEIQVRTMLQGLWAQLVEKLDESSGTDLKHGIGSADALESLKTLSVAFERFEQDSASSRKRSRSSGHSRSRRTEAMSHFLVFYSRRNGEAPRVERIDDSDDAVRRLLEAERELASDPSHGVVMLVAEDEEDLRRTHAHYFESLEDLLRRAAG